MRVDLNAPLPDDPARLLDEFRAARALRLAMEKETEPVAARERLAKEKLINILPKSGDGVVSDGYACRVTTKRVPTIKDWNKFVEYIRNTDRFDMLQKRLADKAVKDTANWEKIPGLEPFDAVDLSVVKI